ncbi:single-stranded DNA-binding protein [Candidatus Uhrbacteria bacterium]|jgi:single-strand DNA-binding protein|nr:MAG: single-stranded DNA-binding protein [Candidatus Uhrbacteria bacterium]
MDLNRAMIIGNVTRDPELRTTATGQNVCSFGIATNQQWTDAQGQKQQRAEYHNIVAWGKLAEICGQYLGKGRKVYIEGRLQTREWETQDAQKRQRTEIVADNMILLDRKDVGSQAPSRTPSPASIPAGESPEPTVAPMDKSIGDNEIRLEDIPF